MVQNQVLVLAIVMTLVSFTGLRASEVRLGDGTRVRVRIMDLVTSETSRPGDAVGLQVADDVVVNGAVAIRRRTPAKGTVVEAAPGRLGLLGAHRALLVFTIDQTNAVDGQPIPLRPVGGKQGEHRIVVGRGTRSQLLLWVVQWETFDVFVDGEHRLIVLSTMPTERPRPEVLTNEDVVKLVEVGISDDVVLAKIQSSRTDFRLRTDDLTDLKKAGVSDRVVIAMIDAARGFIRVPK